MITVKGPTAATVRPQASPARSKALNTTTISFSRTEADSPRGVRRELQHRGTEGSEKRDAGYFAQAALALLEPELAKLDPDATEKGMWAHILEVLRMDPVTIYRICKGNDPAFAAAWVDAGAQYLKGGGR